MKYKDDYIKAIKELYKENGKQNPKSDRFYNKSKKADLVQIYNDLNNGGMEKEQKMVDVEKVESSENEPPKKREKQSCFLITINSNKNAENVEKGYIEEFKRAVYETMKFEKYYKEVITIKDKHKDEPEAHDTYLNKIEVSDSYLEVGPKKKIHSHTVVKIHHNTFIHLNKQFFQRKLLELLPKPAGQNYYVNIKSYRSKEYEQFLLDSERRVIEYSLKDGQKITESAKI